jgi:hypothetical protein
MPATNARFGGVGLALNDERIPRRRMEAPAEPVADPHLAKMDLAETEGFEPSIPVIPV